MNTPTPTAVEPLDDYKLRVRYSDVVEGVADLSDFVGKGIFAPWNDYREFQDVHIGPGGESAWGHEIDMCADAIYLKITGKRPEDMFPKLRELAPYAGD